MPHSHELSDRQVLVDYRHSEAESRHYGRRILRLPLTPYLVGLPYRIGMLRELLDAWR